MIILGEKGGEREEHEVNVKAVGKILFLFSFFFLLT